MYEKSKAEGKAKRKIVKAKQSRARPPPVEFGGGARPLQSN